MLHPPPLGSLDPTPISHLPNPTPSFQSLPKHETQQHHLQPSNRFLWSNHPLGVPPPETLLIIEEFSSPFDYNYDIVTDATCKSLQGPTGIILHRRGTKLRKQGMVANCGDDTGCDFEKNINFALDPTLQGGPHDNHTAALSFASKTSYIHEAFNMLVR